MLNFHHRDLLPQFIAAGRFVFLPMQYEQLSQTMLPGNGDDVLPVGNWYRLRINIAGRMKTQSIATFPGFNMEIWMVIAQQG